MKTNQDIFAEICDKAKMKGFITESEFAEALESILLEDGAVLLDTGNRAQCLAELLLRLEEKIRRYPALWKVFMEG